MIFMNWRSRSSRAMAPKIRVPRGFFSASIRTHGVAVELDVRAVDAPGRVADADDDASDHVAGLDVAAGAGLLDAGDDDVAEAGHAPLVVRGAAAEDLEAHDFLGPGVVGHVEPSLHLDHGTPRRDVSESVLAGQGSKLPMGPGRGRPSPSLRAAAGDRSFLERAGSGWTAVLAASPSPARACWAPGRTIRTIRHRLSLESGRVSMISTRSPTWVSLVSSCAWQTVRRLRNLPYFGCGTRRLDLDPAGLVHLVGRHDPISVLRRRTGPGPRSLGGRGRLAHLVAVRSREIGWRSRGGDGRSSFPIDLAESEDRLDPGDLPLGLDDLARRLRGRSVSLWRRRRNRFVWVSRSRSSSLARRICSRSSAALLMALMEAPAGTPLGRSGEGGSMVVRGMSATEVEASAHLDPSTIVHLPTHSSPIQEGAGLARQTVGRRVTNRQRTGSL